MRDSISIFAFVENYRSHQFSNWWQRYATGISHLDGFESPCLTNIKTPTTDVVGVLMAEDEGFELLGIIP